MTPREEYTLERAAIIWEGNAGKISYKDALVYAEVEASRKEWLWTGA